MANKKKINFVVTDLDDTIWDWLSMWHSSFKPYYEDILNEFNLEAKELKADFKKLHQTYGTSEASNIYQELTTLTNEQKDNISKSKIGKKSIIHRYNSNKKNSLKLYPGVLETLQHIKSQGAIIVGFTESNAFFTKYRIKHLKLDGIFDCIYTPIGYDLPTSVNQIYDKNYWEPELTEIRYLPNSTKKPNKDVLEVILADFKAQKEETIYIGDKLHRDMYMAQQAKVISVYAKYGHNIEGEDYSLLKDVTHWTDKDIEHEQLYKDKHADTPDFILNESYSELDRYFDFAEFPNHPNKAHLTYVLDAWKKIIDVQMHFNDIELKIRNYALTAFTFIIAAMGYLIKEKISLTLFEKDFQASIAVGFIGTIMLSCFYFMDKKWYHKLLKGAVSKAYSIEKKWGKIIPEIQLSKEISKASPISFNSKYRLKNFLYKITFLDKIKIHSDDKYFIFYYPLIFIPTLIALLLIVIHIGGQ